MVFWKGHLREMNTLGVRHPRRQTTQVVEGDISGDFLTLDVASDTSTSVREWLRERSVMLFENEESGSQRE